MEQFCFMLASNGPGAQLWIDGNFGRFGGLASERRSRSMEYVDGEKRMGCIYVILAY